MKLTEKEIDEIKLALGSVFIQGEAARVSQAITRIDYLQKRLEEQREKAEETKEEAK